jgi:NADPH:quinone reductase-like Zn-dependent oxidoreductase
LNNVGNNICHEDGAFAEHIVAKGDLQFKIPDGVSFEEAATLGVGITTVGQGLYQSLGLPLPNKPAAEKFPILIYGGSSATGTLAIQFAKLFVPLYLSSLHSIHTSYIVTHRTLY